MRWCQYNEHAAAACLVRGDCMYGGVQGGALYLHKHRSATPEQTDMVLCSNAAQEDKAFTEQHFKMASELESCVPNVNKVYSGPNVPEDHSLVRCLACKGSQWEGTSQDLISHFKQAHPNSIWWNGDKKRSFRLEDISKDCYHIELVVAYGNLFWLHVKNDLNTNHLYAACQHIVNKDLDPNIRFMIRTELCDASGKNCISCSTETRPHTDDISKIFSGQTCAVRPHSRLQTFVDSNKALSFTVNINRLQYFK